MAKGKTVAMVWVCQGTDCGQINGSMRTMKEKIKDLTRLKYCPRTRVREHHRAKLVKKGS